MYKHIYVYIYIYAHICFFVSFSPPLRDATWEVVAKCFWVVRLRAAPWHWTFTFGSSVANEQRS